jgi:RND family efflux transporter MFP subunit
MKLFAFLMITVLIISCRKDQTSIHPTVENISESVYASGIVKSNNQYQVFSTASGIITGVLVSEGDLVKKGSPLLKIRNEVSELNADNARLAADNAKSSVTKDKLNEAGMAIELSVVKLRNDSLLMVRQRNLMAQNIGTPVDLEQKELNYRNSINSHRSAQINYHDLQQQLALNAEQTKNNLKISNTISNEYTIRSEVDGKVYSLLKVAGESITPQNPVAVIGDSKNFMLELQVDEYDITKITKDQKVILSMDSYKGEVFEALITKINPILNDRSKSFTVEATFTKEPPLLYPFLTVEANIVIHKKVQALTIPRPYLISDSLVLTENNKYLKVTTGLMDYQKVEIISGITKDDVIIKPKN